MGYLTIIAPCVSCGTVITANPDFCPSLRVNGRREPICRNCFDRWNEIHRTSKGLEPERLHPMAYHAKPEENQP